MATITTIFNFTTPTDYIYDSTFINIYNGKASLRLIENPGLLFTNSFLSDVGFVYDPTRAEFTSGVCRQKANSITESYNQPFTSDVGFAYDSALSEFVAGVCRQKSQRPVGATFGATYTSDINGNWGDGTLTGTAVGVPTVSGGKLVLTGGTVRGVTYPSASKFITRQTGCIRLKYTPNYSGIPSGNRAIIGILQGGGEANEIFLYHNSSEGRIFLNSFNSALGIIFDGPIGFFLPTAGVEYEIEFNWDFTTGASRLFINGVQLGSTITGTGTISSFTVIKIGLNYNNSMSADGSFNDVLCFDAPVHISNYTPGYTVPETDYLENVVTCPIYSYLYNIVSLDVPTIVETNAPHYVVNGYYWNGTTWVASSNTYATSMTYAQWVANIVTFPESQLSTGVSAKIIFQSGNTQSSINDITFTINESTYLSTNVTCPEREYTGVGTLVLADSFTTVETGMPRYTLQIGRSGNYIYWSGSAWITSDGTYAQANDKTVFNANLATIDVNGQIYGQFRVHFTDSNIQSNIDELTAELTAQRYLDTNPTIDIIASTYTDELDNLATITGGAGSLRYLLSKNSVFYYWSGLSWVISDGTYTQANTLTDILTNKLTFTTTAINLGIRIFLNSDSTQPCEIDNLTLSTNFVEITTTADIIKKYNFPNHIKGNTYIGTQFTVIVNGVALDLTGASIKMSLRMDKYKSTSDYDLTTANGKLLISSTVVGRFKVIPQIIDIPVGLYYYTIKFTLANGEIKTYIEGQWKIKV